MGPVSRPLCVWDNSAAARQFLHGTAGEVGEGRGAAALSPAIKELRSHCLRHKQVWDFRPTAYGISKCGISAPTAYGISKCGIARSRQPSGAHTSAVRVPPPSATGGRARRRRPSKQERERTDLVARHPTAVAHTHTLTSAIMTRYTF